MAPAFSDEGGVDIEGEVEARAVNSVDGGLHQGTVADLERRSTCSLRSQRSMAAANCCATRVRTSRSCWRGADVFGMAFEDERAQDVMVDFEWDSQPIKKGGLPGESDFAAALHLLRYVGSAK